MIVVKNNRCYKYEHKESDKWTLNKERVMTGTREARLSPQAGMALRLLALTKSGCSERVLAEMLGLSDIALERHVAELRRRGYVDADGERLTVSGSSAGTFSSGHIPMGAFFPRDSFAFAVSRYYAGEHIEFLRLSLDCLRELIRQDRLDAVLYLYDACSSLLMKLRIDRKDMERCFAFIKFGMAIQKEIGTLPIKSYSQILVYHKIRKYAESIGDERSLAYINAAIGQININLRLPKKQNVLHRRMSDGIRRIFAIGDSDIITSSAHVIALWHLIEGHFSRGVNFAWPLLCDESGVHVPRALYVYSSVCALSCGEFQAARNILTMGIRKLANAGRGLEACLLQAILANALIMLGRSREALDLIRTLLDVQKFAVSGYIGIWASRGLALHYFLNGDLEASWKAFAQYMQNIRKVGTSHSNYLLAPFVLDMLAAYHEAGYPFLFDHSLEDELAYSRLSPSLLTRVAALRASGRVRAHDGGWEDPRALSFFEQSLALLRTLNAPVEQAKTLLCLARARRAGGEDAAAREAEEEAWRIHERYGQPPWPEDAPRPERPGEENGLSGTDFYMDFLRTLREQRVLDRNRDVLTSSLLALMALFGAFSGEIWQADESGKPRPLLRMTGAPSVELVPEEPDELHPPAMVLASMEKGTSLFAREVPSRTKTGDGLRVSELIRLCLRVEADGKRACMVYLSGLLPRYRAAAVDTELCALLEQYLSTEIVLHGAHESRNAEEQRPRPEHSRGGHEFLYASPSMISLIRHVDYIAGKDTSVLILGESGVGKEVVARRLHEKSGRAGAFVAVNIASTPGELFESEFYGHEKGSFTGANYRKKGLFEMADGGTLFVDEVADIPLHLQVKLLRVLQERSFMRVGGSKPLSSDFRLIAATNRDLLEDVRSGRFREDLYYRLNVMPLVIPPLRERPEDIRGLAEYFLRYFCARHQLALKPFPPELLRSLCGYSWPGNVRQLKNFVERYTLLSDGNSLYHPRLNDPAWAGSPEKTAEDPARASGADGNPFDLGMSLRDLEDAYFEHVYRRADGAVGGRRGVATVLGISRTTAYAWLDRLELRDKYRKELVSMEK